MRTYFNIKIFGRKIKLQKDDNGSVILGFYSEYILPKLGREELERLENTSEDIENVQKVIGLAKEYIGEPFSNFNIATNRIAQIAASEPAEDISEPLEPLTEECKKYWRNWLKEKEKDIEANKRVLECILQNQPI